MFGRSLMIAVALGATFWGSAGDTRAAGIDDLTTLMDSARVLEAHVFAPQSWAEAYKKFEDAKRSVQMKKSQKMIDQYVEEATEYVENAIKATGVARNTLQEYLPLRDRAIKAKAMILVPELYQAAEDQFIKATRGVESGDKGAIKEAQKAMPLFDNVELEAIRVDMLGQSDQLIAKAIADEAPKYAFTTLDKARTARRKSDSILTVDRYNRDEALTQARRSEYEARHASNIAQSVRSLERNDQAWEKLMLLYEIQMSRVGEAIGVGHLPFDNGPLAAADTLITFISGLKSERGQLASDMGTLTEQVTRGLQTSLGRLGATDPGDDPLELVEKLDRRLLDLLLERDRLAENLDSSQAQLASLETAHAEVTGELSGRLEREERFKSAKEVLNPSEGEVLFNASNDIVLRLIGLSFDIGKSDIKDEHVPLLEKVKQVIGLFPDAQYVVEGHTDASGDAATNRSLSDKRAFAVMQYLRQSLLIPADRIKSMGFGDERPVASNETPEGRAKNRRIDVIIMQ